MRLGEIRNRALVGKNDTKSAEVRRDRAISGGRAEKERKW